MVNSTKSPVSCSFCRLATVFKASAQHFSHVPSTHSLPPNKWHVLTRLSKLKNIKMPKSDKGNGHCRENLINFLRDSEVKKKILLIKKMAWVVSGF